MGAGELGANLGQGGHPTQGDMSGQHSWPGTLRAPHRSSTCERSEAIVGTSDSGCDTDPLALNGQLPGLPRGRPGTPGSSVELGAAAVAPEVQRNLPPFLATLRSHLQPDARGARTQEGETCICFHGGHT